MLNIGMALGVPTWAGPCVWHGHKLPSNATSGQVLSTQREQSFIRNWIAGPSFQRALNLYPHLSSAPSSGCKSTCLGALQIHTLLLWNSLCVVHTAQFMCPCHPWKPSLAGPLWNIPDMPMHAQIVGQAQLTPAADLCHQHEAIFTAWLKG
jgi:hypothetical protein